MKKMICICLITLLSLCACNTKNESNNTQQGCDGNDVCDVDKQADMSAYENFMDEKHQFIEIPMSDFLKKLDADGSGIYYFGYATCPWCVEAVPIMNEAAKAKDLPIYYIDKKADTSDEASAAAIEERLADILQSDENGKPHLYVPLVVVMKDGDIIAHHSDTVEGHDAHERKMTKEEQEQLKAVYEDMFQLLM